MIFETNRLYLRELTQDDYFDLVQILQNPNVMYAYEHDFTNEDVQIWLNRQFSRYKKYHFGLWAVILKSTNEMIGQAGLSMQPYHNDEILEIGYLFKDEFWHQGYASEVAQACKNYAFSQLKAKKVFAIIKSDNVSSIAVAKRIGMKKVDEFNVRYYNDERLHYLYAVENLCNLI